jgi:hypothetical protein
VKDKKRHEIDKAIELKVVGGWDGKTKTATADQLKLTSSFATMDGKGGAALAGEDAGDPGDAASSLDADLGEAGRQARELHGEAARARRNGDVTASASARRWRDGELQGHPLREVWPSTRR